MKEETHLSRDTTKVDRRKTAAKQAKAEQASDLAVGARLKVVREKAGLTQRELAKRSGIEQEAHAPSLASLHRILGAVPISIADFFAIPTSQKNVLFYDAGDLAVVTRGAADLRVLGSERRDKKLQLFVEHYQPGAGTGREALVHDGETAAIVIEGIIEVTVGGEKRVLTAGGGYQVFGGQPYRLRNIGKIVAVVACACTPPMI